jgi:hypothetical protein
LEQKHKVPLQVFVDLLERMGKQAVTACFQDDNINDGEWSKQIIDIFNKNAANVETSLLSEYKFVHKIKSIMQEKTWQHSHIL